jgi:putative transposase
MGSRGNAYDNARTEAFFATLETELLIGREFAADDEVRLALFDFIEAFPDLRRRYSALGYLPPVEFKRQW